MPHHFSVQLNSSSCEIPDSPITYRLSSNPSMSSFTFSSNSHSEFESTSSTSTNPSRKKYDVYLSFCDEDPDSLVFGIYTALTSTPVDFWYDQWFRSYNRTLRRSEATLNVIGECKIAIILLSKNYTNSKWCLQELEKITECSRTTDGLIVLPFFYDGLYDMYGEAFHDFLDRISMEETSKKEDKFMSWVAAISHNTAYIYEGPKHFKVKYR
jgi:hypothetical protein